MTEHRPLPRKVAAVDLLNVLRPVVAIGTYITFIAHALHTHPEWRERIRAGDDAAVSSSYRRFAGTTRSRRWSVRGCAAISNGPVADSRQAR